VSPDDEVDRVVVQNAALDHGFRTTDRLFSRLKQEREFTREIVAPPRQEIGDAEETRGVHIVTARVHDSFVD
jgi:hypothetical protein